MTAMILPVPPSERRQGPRDRRMQVVVNIQAEVLDSEVARRLTNVWLLENVGNLLGVEKPELILGERLFWRFDIMLGHPNLEQPGKGDLLRIAQILLDAETGEIQNADTLIAELQFHVATHTVR